jgi:hypothetical protein
MKNGTEHRAFISLKCTVTEVLVDLKRIWQKLEFIFVQKFRFNPTSHFLRIVCQIFITFYHVWKKKQ